MGRNQMSNSNVSVVLGVLWIFVHSVTATAGDIPGSKDSPLLKRYEGSTIIKYSRSAFAQYVLPLGPVMGALRDAKLTKSTTLGGSVTRITYLIPPERSPFEVVRNYEMELKNGGYTVLYKGSTNDLNQSNFKQSFSYAAGYDNIDFGGSMVASITAFAQFSSEQNFLSATLERPEGAVHVAVFALKIGDSSPYLASDIPRPGSVLAQVDIIESKPMETKMVTVSADDMAAGIANTGSIALYGILFDTNSAEIKPESTATLQEIVRLLQKQPDLKLLVVGHTDNVGTFGFNMDLSKRRANAVVQALTNGHGIDPTKLMAVGVSYASPVASNKAEEGRAKNRRVQLVEN